MIDVIHLSIFCTVSMDLFYAPGVSITVGSNLCIDVITMYLAVLSVVVWFAATSRGAGYVTVVL